jgi:O-antigen/teichoic acid export membrane protein
LVLVRVLTEYLGPAEYGVLALVLTIAGLVNEVVVGGVVHGIGRFYSIAVEKCDLGGYLKASRQLMGYVILAIGAIALLMILGLTWTHQFQWIRLAAAVLVFAILCGCNSCLIAVQNAARQRSIVALHGCADAWVKVGLAVGGMLWLGASTTTVVMGYALSILFVTISQSFFLRRLLHWRSGSVVNPIDINWTKQMWSYSWPFSIWGIFTWTHQVSDRWSLKTFANTQDVGQYAVVFQLGYTPISLVIGMGMAFLGPILYQRSGATNDNERNRSVHHLAWRITGISLTVTGVAFLISLLLHDWLFQLLVAAPFRASSRFLPWLVLAGGLFAAGQMLGVKLASEMKTQVQLCPKIGTAVLGASLNIIGAWQFGMVGVVAALLMFSITYFVWMAYIAKQIPSTR